MSLHDPFNALLRIQSQAVTLYRPGGDSVSVFMAPSNFFRTLDGPASTVIEGHEFVISKVVLDDSNFGAIKRGDRIATNDMGTLTVDSIREMFDFGGSVIGYRVRTN